MNLENKNQMNQLIKQINPYFINKENEYDLKINQFNYIKREKKIIKFVNSNFNIIIIKIPTFITKFDLYSIAHGEKVFVSTNILLIHNNKILNRDESSIDEINDYDFVIIIENRLYPDEFSYTNLRNKYPLNYMISLLVTVNNGAKRIYNLCREATIKEFFDMVIKSNGLFERDIHFINKAKKININSPQKIKDSELGI